MTYYSDITKIPLGIFLDCYVDGNLRSLVISGEPTEKELQTAWDLLQDAFAMRMANNEQRIFLTLLREVNGYVATINQANALISVMEETYNIQFGLMINKILKINLPWSESDRELINPLIKKCKSAVKSVEMKHHFKNAALQAIERKVKKNTSTEPNRSYFDLLLNLIEEHFSVPIDYNITVSRFCDKLKRMEEQLKKRKFK